MRSRSPRDGPNIVLKRRKWRRGTSPRALDLLLEIEECIKKKPFPVSRLDQEHRVEVGRAMLKDRIRGCPYDCLLPRCLAIVRLCQR